MNRSYPLVLLPPLVGLFVGVLVAFPFPLGSEVAEAYVALPEFSVWAVGIIIQLSVYTSVLAYLWWGPVETEFPALPARDGTAVAVLTVAVIVLPDALATTMATGDALPLPYQRTRLWVVVGSGLLAILFLTNRLAKIHRAFSSGDLDLAGHASFRRETKDLLAIAAVVVTLATLGSATLEQSVHGLESVVGSDWYASPIGRPHVVAYGAYSTLLLAIFFTPVLLADRRAAHDLRGRAEAGDEDADLVRRLGLDAGLLERIGSVLGVLSPLLGALAAQFLP